MLLKSYLKLCYYLYFVAVLVIYHNSKRDNRNYTLLVYMEEKNVCCIFSPSVHVQLSLPSLPLD